mgnify:CR=1 FL=1
MVGRCGNTNPLRVEDFHRLQPKEKWCACSIKIDQRFYPNLKEGTPYTVNLFYQMAGNGKSTGLHGENEWSTSRRLREALRCDLTSKPVTIVFGKDAATLDD